MSSVEFYRIKLSPSLRRIYRLGLLTRSRRVIGLYLRVPGWMFPLHLR